MIKIGIVGLGLIGGSVAKGYKENSDNMIYGFDKDSSIVEFAQISGAIDGKLTDEAIKDCSSIIIALPPKATMDFLREKSEKFPKGCLVIDCGGVKREICKLGFSLGEKHGYTFIGGHPMAGTHKFGFKNSLGNMFDKASMVICPPVYDNMALLEEIKALLKPLGFSKITVSSPEDHDRRIAFTSQMPHIVSGAYIKSPRAREHKGISAGSYKDLTRVAWLNPPMWTEIFMDNRDNLLEELNIFIASMEKYRAALENEDTKALIDLLEEGSKIKEEVDGR